MTIHNIQNGYFCSHFDGEVVWWLMMRYEENEEEISRLARDHQRIPGEQRRAASWGTSRKADWRWGNELQPVVTELIATAVCL